MSPFDFGSPLPSESPESALAWQGFTFAYGSILYSWCTALDVPTGGDHFRWLCRHVADALNAPEAAAPDQASDSLVTFEHPPLTLTRADGEALMYGLFYTVIAKPSHYDADQAMAVVLLHSALEHFVQQRGGSPRESLVPSLTRLTSTPPRLPPIAMVRLPDLATPLVVDEFDAVRHLVVHSQGVVDERFLARLRDSGRYVLGEAFPLTTVRVWRYFDHVLRTAALLRRCTA